MDEAGGTRDRDEELDALVGSAEVGVNDVMEAYGRIEDSYFAAANALEARPTTVTSNSTSM